MAAGRPAIFTDSTMVSINSTFAKSKLQLNSDRRAIVVMVMDNGGRATVKEINDHFDFDLRDKIIRLVRIGWLEVIQ